MYVFYHGRNIKSSYLKDTTLEQVIRGKGAFRRFKNTIRYLGIEDEWYQYQASEYRRKAIEWCEKNELEYEK